MEKEVEVSWNGQKVKVVLSSITYGDYKKIKRKSIIVKDVDGKKLEFRDVELYDQLFVLISIKDAPFEKTIENLNKLSIEDGLNLEIEVNKINFPE